MLPYYEDATALQQEDQAQGGSTVYSAGIEYVEALEDEALRDRFYGFNTLADGRRKRYVGVERVLFTLYMLADEEGHVAAEYTQKRIARMIGCAEGNVAGCNFRLIHDLALLTDFNSARTVTTPHDRFPATEPFDWDLTEVPTPVIRRELETRSDERWGR